MHSYFILQFFRVAQMTYFHMSLLCLWTYCSLNKNHISSGKNMYWPWRYTTQKLLKENQVKSWNDRSLQKLLRKLSSVDRCTSGCVVECQICSREVAGSNLGLGYFAPRSTQPSIPPGSVNEYQLGWEGKDRCSSFCLRMKCRVCRLNCVIPWQCMLYLSALDTLRVEVLYRSTTFMFTFTGVQGAADHKQCILQKTWFCWWRYDHSGRCATDTSVST